MNNLSTDKQSFRATTILAVRRQDEISIAGDGQITFGEVIVKQTAKKVRRLYKDQVLAGFAGSVADALTLFDRFESQLEKHSGQLKKAAVELAREWRLDRALHHLEAQLIVADKEEILVISGDGDVIEPDEDVVAIGSGAGYAQAAATALLRYSNLSAEEIAFKSMQIAASICIYTNEKISMVSIKRQ